MRKIGFAVFLFTGLLLMVALTLMPAQKVSGQEEGTPVFLPIVDQGDELAEGVDAQGTPRWWWRRTPKPPEITPIAPTATPGPATATPSAGHDHGAMYWHAPGKHGETTVHEHGDAPPQWVVDFNGGQPAFEHVAGTPNENGHDGNAWWKHTSFKGWAGRFSNVNWYGVFHMDFNPSGHPSRFHSYQLWLQDATGAVSHMTGWLDFGTGNNTGPQVVVTCGGNFTERPVMAVNQRPSLCPGGVSDPIFESWYARVGGSGPGNASGGWKPDFGFNINSNYYAGGDPANPATWEVADLQNLNRRMEFAWYADRSRQRGAFWATQFAEVVSGPNDALCGTTVTVGTKTYTRVCLQQYIATTLPTISFPGNSVQRTFPGPGVQLPN